jgi:hypothetical protein
LPSDQAFLLKARLLEQLLQATYHLIADLFLLVFVPRMQSLQIGAGFSPVPGVLAHASLLVGAILSGQFTLRLFNPRIGMRLDIETKGHSVVEDELMPGSDIEIDPNTAVGFRSILNFCAIGAHQDKIVGAASHQIGIGDFGILELIESMHIERSWQVLDFEVSVVQDTKGVAELLERERIDIGFELQGSDFVAF